MKNIIKTVVKKNSALNYLSALYREHQQRMSFESSKRYHTRRAAELGLGWRTEAEIAEALRQRLEGRRKASWPKPKDELHVFVAHFVNNCEKILPRALQVFGRVTEFNWRQHGFDDLSPDWVKQRDRMNAAMIENLETANRIQPVDAVVGYLSGYNTRIETLERMARVGPAIFNFCWDDRLKYPERYLDGRPVSTPSLARAIDLNITQASDNLERYWVNGGIALFSPESAWPEFHKPIPGEFNYDVSFVGSCYGYRPKLVAYLQRHGIKIECFGRDWPRGSVSDDEMVNIFSRSRVNLGFSGIGYSIKLCHLKGRDFEVPMSGGLYLTSYHRELDMVYDTNQEICTYRSKAECLQKINYFLANPKESQNIREAGRMRALHDHTYEARWSKIFRLAGILV